MNILIIIENTPTETNFFYHLHKILSFLEDVKIDLFFHKSANHHLNSDETWYKLSNAKVYACPSYFSVDSNIHKEVEILTIPQLAEKLKSADRVLVL